MAKLDSYEESAILQAKASFHLILDYCNAGDLIQARDLFDALVGLNNYEEIIIIRATVSINLIHAYSRAGDLTQAQAIFDAMPTDNHVEIRNVRAKASFLLIMTYSRIGKADYFQKAQKIFEELTTLGDNEEFIKLRAMAQEIFDNAKK